MYTACHQHFGSDDTICVLCVQMIPRAWSHAWYSASPTQKRNKRRFYMTSLPKYWWHAVYTHSWKSRDLSKIALHVKLPPKHHWSAGKKQKQNINKQWWSWFQLLFSTLIMPSLLYYQKNFGTAKHKCCLLGYHTQNALLHARMTHEYLQHTSRPSNQHLCFALPNFFSFGSYNRYRVTKSY